jgi:cytoskeletal protein CcmA (bactofilin family)
MAIGMLMVVRGMISNSANNKGHQAMTIFGGRKPSQPIGHTTGTDNPPPITVNRQPAGYETVVGASTTLKGDLRSKANARVDGTLEGAIDVDGNLMIGETAKITGNINAQNEAKIAGAVRGNITARKVHLGRTARVWGDLTAATLVTDEGAFVDGKINMTKHPASTQGFSAALPNPEITISVPDELQALEGDMVDAEIVDDTSKPHDV